MVVQTPASGTTKKDRLVRSFLVVHKSEGTPRGENDKILQRGMGVGEGSPSRFRANTV